jgi:hypothetical protein
VKLAAPEALRLVCAGPARRPPRPPFGLAGWSDSAGAVAVLLDATDKDLAEAPAIAAQIPLASTLPPGTAVFVLGTATRARRGLGRLLGWVGPAAVPVARAARCGALVARGYTGIGALVDAASGADLVYAVS